MYVVIINKGVYLGWPTFFISMSIFKHGARARQAKFKFHIRLSFRGDFKIAVTAAILDIVDYSNYESQFMYQCLHKSSSKIAHLVRKEK